MQVWSKAICHHLPPCREENLGTARQNAGPCSQCSYFCIWDLGLGITLEVEENQSHSEFPPRGLLAGLGAKTWKYILIHLFVSQGLGNCP